MTTNEYGKTLGDSLENLIHAINSLGMRDKRAEVIRDRFSRTHRTLQQMFVANIIIPILTQLSEQHVLGQTDARNQAACALANKMLNAVEDNDLYLPFI